MAAEVMGDITVTEDESLAADPEILAKATEIRRQLQAEGEKRFGIFRSRLKAAGITANARQASQLFYAVEPAMAGGEYGGLAAAAFGPIGIPASVDEGPELLDESGQPVEALGAEPAAGQPSFEPGMAQQTAGSSSSSSPGPVIEEVPEEAQNEPTLMPRQERGPVTLPWENFGFSFEIRAKLSRKMFRNFQI